MKMIIDYGPEGHEFYFRNMLWEINPLKNTPVYFSPAAFNILRTEHKELLNFDEMKLNTDEHEWSDIIIDSSLANLAVRYIDELGYKKTIILE